jgi:hypothetical protein
MDIKTLKSEIYQMLDPLDEQGLNEVNEMVTAYIKNRMRNNGMSSLMRIRPPLKRGWSRLKKG